MTLKKLVKIKKVIDRELLPFRDWHYHHDGKYYNRNNPKYVKSIKNTPIRPIKIPIKTKKEVILS